MFRSFAPFFPYIWCSVGPPSPPHLSPGGWAWGPIPDLSLRQLPGGEWAPVKITFKLVLSTGLSIFWSNARSRGFTLHDVVRVLCEEPAKLSRLNHRKGKIALGMEADLLLWDPDECFVVRKDWLFLTEQDWKHRPVAGEEAGETQAPPEIFRFELNSAAKVEFCLLKWKAVNGTYSFQVLPIIVRLCAIVLLCN